MKKVMMTLIMGIVALTAGAQNTLHETGSFTFSLRSVLAQAIFQDHGKAEVRPKVRLVSSVVLRPSTTWVQNSAQPSA